MKKLIVALIALTLFLSVATLATSGLNAQALRSDDKSLGEDGGWGVVASWEGDYDHKGAVGKEVTFNAKLPSEIIISVSPREAEVGKELTVTGRIDPPRAGVEVTLIYKSKAAGEVYFGGVARKVTTASDGSFTDILKPDIGGPWTVSASWKGDDVYEGAGTEVTFEAVEKRCIIATSTYGSESAVEVQFLRAFREGVVHSTYAGSQFMKVFNAWYYSWSPAFAAFIWDHPEVKPIMEGLLYPLLGTLHLAALTSSAFSSNSEVGVITAGLVASSLIGIVYFAPPTTLALLAVRRLKKRLLKVGQLKPLAAVWLVSIVLMVLGETAASQTLMMAATGIFVVATVALSTGTIALKLASIKTKT